MQTKNPEDRSVQRRKILLVGVEPSVQGLISTFLLSMGCTCTVVQNMEETPIILERETFGAVVIDLGPSVAGAEQAILRIKQIRPSLGGRMIAISSGVADREMSELMERHNIVRLSQEGMLPQLWTTIQEFLIGPRLWQQPVRSMGIPRIIFDSFRSPVPAGVRSLSPGARQLAYEYKNAIIDLSIEFQEGSGRTSIAGQVLYGERKGASDGLSVLLVSGIGTLARTVTNQFGEFHLGFESADAVSLEIRLGERSWILVPLGKMDWPRKPMPARAAEG